MPNLYDISYIGGLNYVQNIPEDFRIYDRRTGLLTKISEGRANFMRLLLNYAKSQGAWVATDVKTTWGLEYDRLARIYFSANSTSSSGTKHDLLYVSNAEGRRIQPDDIFNLMGFFVSTSRGLANATGQGMTTKSASYPLPEQVKVLQNFGEDSGGSGITKIQVRRNFGGAEPTGHADLAVTYNATTYSITGGTPFLWKSGNSMLEGSDDQLVYSDVDQTDYNYCQIVMRKWGATETEQNVNRFWSPEKTFQRNGRRALEEFFKELDNIGLFGTRRVEYTDGKARWYAGGLHTFIPASNHVGYSDTLFQTANFNNQLKDMFYYGSQTKLGIVGADFYTKFSNMIDNKVVLPAAVNSWGVELTRFNATNGGTLLLAPSDTLSLHGMADYAYIFDPVHFQYGHLQNMDIKTIEVPQTNPHKMEAEVYGQITFKRTNPFAHWVFMKTA